LTGLNTPKHGIFTVGNSDRGDEKTRKLIPIVNQVFISDTVWTLAQFLKDQGYVTGSFGKWHITENPKKQGFDINIGGSHRGNPGKDGYFSPYNIDYIENGPEGEYLTDRLTHEAIKFIENNQDTTFFLYLPFYAVHTPITGKPELVSKFEKKRGSQGQNRADYAAMIASVDENVGRLLKTLDDSGLSENTLLIFTSDNGAIRNVSKQNPLRAGKGSYYEGGIRVPLIFRWPGKLNKNNASDYPVSQLDIFPTIYKIVCPEKPLPKDFDGINLQSLFIQNTHKERTLFWHFPIYLEAYDPKEDDGRDPIFRTRPGSIIRKGDWKLHVYFEEGEIELYYLKDDPGERNNLVSSFPDKSREMYNLLKQWWEINNAPIPELKNPAYDEAYEKLLLSGSMPFS
jgi:arylsulfatase A-like enzyme